MEYGITDEDVYNFDETGFQMGVMLHGLVVTAKERSSGPKHLQPGTREWVTVIVAVQASGHPLPPFVIFKAKKHQTAWYAEHLPRDWILAVSSNGWITNEIALGWVKHFNAQTVLRSRGRHRMLIMDGRGSHRSQEFLDFCNEHKIVCVCLPPHSSHKVQPLDVGCFGPLKQAYSQELQAQMGRGIQHVCKEEFLDLLKKAWAKAMTRGNILSSFRGTGLVPYDPSKRTLDIGHTTSHAKSRSE